MRNIIALEEINSRKGVEGGDCDYFDGASVMVTDRKPGSLAVP